MKSTVQSSDPDIRGSWPALLRAAKNARRLSLETGTPFYIFKNGKIVDLNRGTTKRRKKA
jgi:hypothetical protein